MKRFVRYLQSKSPKRGGTPEQCYGCEKPITSTAERFAVGKTSHYVHKSQPGLNCHQLAAIRWARERGIVL